jgi:hypothetical protein
MKFRCKTGSPPNAAEAMAENTVMKAYKLKRISSMSDFPDINTGAVRDQ